MPRVILSSEGATMTAKDIFKLVVRLGGVYLFVQTFWKLTFVLGSVSGLGEVAKNPPGNYVYGAGQDLLVAVFLFLAANWIADVGYRRDP
jgi:hypothetical protein